MGVGAGLYMYDVVAKKFTFAISSPDEFLLVVDDGLCKRKFVLYFCFVAIFCTFCGPFY